MNTNMRCNLIVIMVRVAGGILVIWHVYTHALSLFIFIFGKVSWSRACYFPEADITYNHLKIKQNQKQHAI